MRAALLLVRVGAAAQHAEVLAQARELARCVPGAARVQACVAVQQPLAYIYAWSEAPCAHDGARRLAPIAEYRGASAGERAPYHYVVATDIESGWEEELNRWYRDEHMPGLAAVPGNVHCARLQSLDGAPRYHACYDLVSPAVLERREWLAVRHTEWSSRVRPHFRNTVRIMFRTLLDDL
jgi:hypothetical protein